jgi:hypothetical protein
MKTERMRAFSMGKELRSFGEGLEVLGERGEGC